MAELKMLAFDLGASNGRAVYGVWKEENLKIKLKLPTLKMGFAP